MKPSQLQTDWKFMKGIDEARQKGIKGKAKWLVYLNHFITGWDDNIWDFALGLFLVEITPQSLQFTATYGLAAGCAVLLFGTVVGDWVDTTPRLTVARVSVLVQNSALITCSVLVFLVMTFKAEIAALLPGEAVLRICYVLIVVIAIISYLTNMARTTAIERDWIVEICDKDKDMLANLSATMRRISLATRIVAPIVIGQILNRTSHPTGALVVAGWNFMTIFLEYFLLWKIYQDVPQLHRLKIKGETMETRIALMDGPGDIMEFADLELQATGDTDKQTGVVPKVEDDNLIQRKVHEPGHSHTDSGNELEPNKTETEKAQSATNGKGEPGQRHATTEHLLRQSQTSLKSHTNTGKPVKTEEVKYKATPGHFERDSQAIRGWKRLFTNCITLHRGWRIYKSYDVAFAGLGLASLYLTVLGFHHITTGYVYSQGLSEDLIGGLRGAAALSGIVGTILYPIVRRKFGIQRTGLYALAAQICSLTLCVISVFSPGSPFDPLYFTRSKAALQKTGDNNLSSVLVTPVTANTTDLESLTFLLSNVTESHFYGSEVESPKAAMSYASIVLLLTGIIGSRAGLWMADLAITQLFLESVDVTERGIVNGVQNAINQLMELIKFAIVILLPVPEVFGYLVLLSFCFICLGWVLVAVYVNRARGYLLPCSKKRGVHKSIR